MRTLTVTTCLYLYTCISGSLSHCYWSLSHWYTLYILWSPLSLFLAYRLYSLCISGSLCHWYTLYIGLASDDVTKHSNAWQRGKLVLNKGSAPHTQKHAGRKVPHWAKLYIPSWRGLNGFANPFTAQCVTFQKIMGIGQVRGRFSIDRRSPSMLLYGTLSLCTTNFVGCGAVTQHLQALYRGLSLTVTGLYSPVYLGVPLSLLLVIFPVYIGVPPRLTVTGLLFPVYIVVPLSLLLVYIPCRYRGPSLTVTGLYSLYISGSLSHCYWSIFPVNCKSRIFHMHVIFVYFVCGGFRTKIKCMRKGQIKSENRQRSATARKFYAYERSESPGYENWVRTKYSGFTIYRGPSLTITSLYSLYISGSLSHCYWSIFPVDIGVPLSLLLVYIPCIYRGPSLTITSLYSLYISGSLSHCYWSIFPVYIGVPLSLSLVYIPCVYRGPSLTITSLYSLYISGSLSHCYWSIFPVDIVVPLSLLLVYIPCIYRGPSLTVTGHIPCIYRGPSLTVAGHIPCIYRGPSLTVTGHIPCIYRGPSLTVTGLYSLCISGSLSHCYWSIFPVYIGSLSHCYWSIFPVYIGVPLSLLLVYIPCVYRGPSLTVTGLYSL